MIVFLTENGHVANLPAIKVTKEVTPTGTEKGAPLTLLAKDLKPWHSEHTWEPVEDDQDFEVIGVALMQLSW